MRENSEIVDIVISLYKQKGWSLSEFARKLEMPKSSLSRYLNKNRQFPVNKTEIFADKLNTTVEYILGLELENQSTPSIPQSITKITPKVTYLDKELKDPRHSQWISHGERLLEEQLDEQEKEQLEKRKTLEISEPLFEYYVYEKLSAGTGATYWEERNYDTVYFDKEITHDLASWVYGDSMEPKYLDGSVALIKDTGFDYDGAIYAVDWDGQSYIKKVYKEKDGLRLVSLNSKYADKFAPYTEDPRIIGKVIGNFMPMER